MNKSSPPEIIIITGEQAGARASLADNYSVTLSGESDTDMVLRDARIDRERLKILTKNNKAYIEVIDGKIEVEGNTIDQGKKIRLDEYAKVKLGDTVFIYTRDPSVPFKDILNKVTSDIRTTNSSYYPLKPDQVRNNILLSISVLLIVLVAVISTVTSSYDRTDQISMSSLENIHSLLIENGYESLNVTRESDSQITIMGFVMTNQERALLENLVDEHKVAAVLDLEVGDELAMEVRELFRVNGIEVVANVIQKGEVNAVIKARSSDGLDNIKEVALKEIADLKSLNIELAEFAEEEETIGSDMSYKEADKRITMVVDGDPAYIMTSDQSKYYIGALLPTGYKIIDIIDQQVVLEKKGMKKTLEF